jgi:hypothetical protein
MLWGSQSCLTETFTFPRLDKVWSTYQIRVPQIFLACSISQRQKVEVELGTSLTLVN